MNTEPHDPIWEKLAKTLFGAHRTEDTGLFTYSVMQEIRLIQPAFRDMTWHQFFRWAVPALGVGVATLVLATRTPALSSSLWMETALFHQQTPDEDPLIGALQTPR